MNERERGMTMYNIIDSEAVLTLLALIVEEKGEDFVYPDEWRDVGAHTTDEGGCLYFRDERQRQPGCIIGHLIHGLGAGVTHEGDRAGALNQFIADDALRFSSRALLTMDAAQRVQDQGGTWGQALAHASEERRFHPHLPDDDVGSTQRASAPNLD